MSLDKVESSNPNRRAVHAGRGRARGELGTCKRFECCRCRTAKGVVLPFPDSRPTFEYSPSRGESPLCFAKLLNNQFKLTTGRTTFQELHEAACSCRSAIGRRLGNLGVPAFDAAGRPRTRLKACTVPGPPGLMILALGLASHGDSGQPCATLSMLTCYRTSRSLHFPISAVCSLSGSQPEIWSVSWKPPVLR